VKNYLNLQYNLVALVISICEVLQKPLPKRINLLQFENNSLYLCMVMIVLAKFVLFYNIRAFQGVLT